ncbi:hypothetical protein pb186bvf_010127 [Paramecium bursaria]
MLNRSISPAGGASKKYQSSTSPAPRKPIFGQSEQSSILGDLNNQSKISNMTQFANYMYVPCPSHQELFITNFCQDPQCFEPLCPECITNHIDFHQQKGLKGKIENIQKVRKEHSASIDETVHKLTLRLNDQKRFFAEYPQQRYQSVMDQLRTAHQKCIELVDNYFQNLQQQLKESPLDDQVQEFTKIESEGLKLIQTLNKLQEDLHNDNYVRSIIQISENRKNFFESKYITAMDTIQKNVENAQLKVYIDDFQIKMIEENIRKYCFFSKTTSVPAKVLYQQPQSELDREKENHTKYIVQKITPLIKPTTHISDILINQQLQSNITAPNHFDDGVDNTYIKLEDDTKNIFIYNGEQIQKKTLNTQLRVPSHHRFYHTKQGQYLIIGGINKDKARFKATGSILELNLEQLTLLPHSEMILPRAMTACCQYDDYLYVVGGTTTNDENTSIAKAERLNLNTRKWTSISDPQHKCSGCSLVHHGKYLVKIGGKTDIFTPCNQIELYEISKDNWALLEYKFTSTGYLRLPFNAAAATISHGQILIIGGSVHDVSSDETQILNIDEKTIKKSIPLPKPLEFSSQAIITNGQLIAYTDDPIQLLTGTGEYWQLQ